MTCCGGEDDTAEDVGSTANKKYGEPKKFDPNFKGVMKNRSCTDVICCIIFVIFILGMIVCSIVGYARGDPVKLVYPTDSNGNLCGQGEYADRKFLFFFDILKCAQSAAVISLGCATPQICVRSCPTEYWSFVQTEILEAASQSQLVAEREKMICKYNTDPQSARKSVRQYVKDEDCAPYYVKSTPVINRCVPSIFMDITSWSADITYKYQNRSFTVTDAQSSNVTGQAVSDGSYILARFYDVREFVELVYKDILNVWWMILVGCAVAAALCMIWLVLLRWLAAPIIWVTIAGVFGLLIFACYYSYSEYYELKSLNATSDFGLSQAFALNFSYYLSLKKTWLAFGCITATIITILLLLFLFLVRRICVAIELIKEASRAVGSMFSTLFWPLMPFLFQIAFCVYWAASVIYIASMGDSKFYSNATNKSSDGGINYYLSRVPCNPDSSTLGSLCEFVKYGGNEYIIPMQIFMLFMLLWILNFVVALSHMTLAGAFSSYYWAWEKPKDIPAFPCLTSLYISLRFHMGSLAFGSFIIALVQIIRIMLEYLEYKLKDAENRVAKFILRCLKCCFWCLEKFLKFLNKNAYIMIAIHGKNFCVSAKDAFFLIMRNIIRVAVLDKLTDFLLFLSKALITGAVFILAFMWFKGSITYFDSYIKRPELNYYLSPVIILTVCTYLMTCVFFSVYSMAVDTLFLCFLEDLEMNDGSPEKPYFMSKGLMKVVGKKNLNLRDPAQPAMGEMSSKVSPELSKGRPLPQPRGVLRLKKEESFKSES